MKKTQEKGTLNPDFKTTCYYDMKSLTKDEILNILKNNPSFLILSSIKYLMQHHLKE